MPKSRNSRHRDGSIWEEKRRCNVTTGIVRITFALSVVLDEPLCRLDIVAV